MKEQFHIFESHIERVPFSGCWIWVGRLSKDGYGKYGQDGLRAHRLSWAFANGAIPAGLFVLHRCDIPVCVNPDHLFLGTAKENAEDAHKKNRGAVGARHGMSKLTCSSVVAMRKMREDTKLTFSEIGKLFGVSGTCAAYACTGKTWAHVPPAEQSTTDTPAELFA